MSNSVFCRPLFVSIHVQKFISTFIRPTLLPHSDVYDFDGAASFVAKYLAYQPLKVPNELVSKQEITLVTHLVACTRTLVLSTCSTVQALQWKNNCCANVSWCILHRIRRIPFKFVIPTTLMLHLPVTAAQAYSSLWSRTWTSDTLSPCRWKSIMSARAWISACENYRLSKFWTDTIRYDTDISVTDISVPFKR